MCDFGTAKVLKGGDRGGNGDDDEGADSFVGTAQCVYFPLFIRVYDLLDLTSNVEVFEYEYLTLMWQ